MLLDEEIEGSPPAIFVNPARPVNRSTFGFRALDPIPRERHSVITHFTAGVRPRGG